MTADKKAKILATLGPATRSTPPATSGGSTCRIRRSSMPWNRA